VKKKMSFDYFLGGSVPLVAAPRRAAPEIEYERPDDVESDLNETDESVDDVSPLVSDSDDGTSDEEKGPSLEYDSDETMMSPRGHERGPYKPFANATRFVLLLIVMGHGVTRSAYDAIRTVVNATWSDNSEWCSWKTLMSGKRLMPVLPLYKRKVGSRLFGMHSLFDVIRRILVYPGNMDVMVFQPTSGPLYSELWHGALWRTSPLFTEMCVSMKNGETVALFDQIQYQDDEGKIRLGRLVAISRRESNRQEVVCHVLRYLEHTDDVDDALFYRGNELLLDWSVEKQICIGDIMALANIDEQYTSDDRCFCDRAIIRSPTGDTTTMRVQDLPQHPSEYIELTADKDAYNQAKVHSRGMCRYPRSGVMCSCTGKVPRSQGAASIHRLLL